jgi:hypothetical protein
MCSPIIHWQCRIKLHLYAQMLTIKRMILRVVVFFIFVINEMNALLSICNPHILGVDIIIGMGGGLMETYLFFLHFLTYKIKRFI